MNFVIDNYVWFVVISVVLILALIGYIADNTHFEEKAKDKKKKSIDDRKKKKEELKKEENDEIENADLPDNGFFEDTDFNKVDDTTSDSVNQESNDNLSFDAPLLNDDSLPEQEIKPVEDVKEEDHIVLKNDGDDKIVNDNPITNTILNDIDDIKPLLDNEADDDKDNLWKF